MKNVFIYLTFIFAVVFLVGFAFSFGMQDGDGKSLFVEKKCTTCHSVETAGLESKKKEPVDLSSIGDTYDAEFLVKYLNKEEAIDGKEHSTKMKGTEEEIKTVAEWLGSLKSDETK